MKVSIIFLIAGVVGPVVVDASQEDDNIGLVQAFGIHYFLGSRCPYKVQRKVMGEQKKATECVKNIKSNTSICDSFVNYFKPCIRGLLEISEKCEYPDRHAFKKAVLDSVIEEVRYVCDTDGEHIFELLNPCTMKGLKKSGDCNSSIGMRAFDRYDLDEMCRVSEHKRDALNILNPLKTKKENNTALAEHVSTTLHSFDFKIDSIKILELLEKRLLHEMVSIKQDEKSINKRTDIENLNTAYYYLINKIKDKT